MRRKRLVFYIDRVDKEGEINEARWQLKVIDREEVYEGKGIKEFFDIVMEIKGNIIIYTWELEYEGSYIEYYLSRQGYEYGTIKESKSYDNLENCEGKYYVINIRDENKREIKFQSIHHKYGNLDLRKAKKSFEVKADGEIHIIEKLIKFSWEKDLKGLTCGMDSFMTYKKMIGKKEFDRLYPKLTHEEDDYLREAFKGGIVYIRGNINEEQMVSVYDINSAYGSILRDSKLPYGRGKYYIGRYQEDDRYCLYVQRIRIHCRLKEGMIPFINIRKDLKSISSAIIDRKGYLLGTREEIEIKLTNYEIGHLRANYNIYSIKYIDGIKYKGSDQNFKKYINYYYELKQKGGALGSLGKSMIVNLYGKFASKEDRQSKRIYYDKEKDEIVKYSEERIGKLIYLPVSVFVTSALRDKLLEVMEKNVDTLLYSDTDCIHLRQGVHKGIEIGRGIGQFKLEAYCIRAKYLGRKKYCYEAMEKKEDGTYKYDSKTKIKAVFSGVCMDKENLTYEEFVEGKIIKSKCYRAVRGGTIISHEYIVI